MSTFDATAEAEKVCRNCEHKRLTAKAIQDAHTSGLKQAMDEMWHAMKAVAHSTPSLYIPSELLDYVATAEGFIRHADNVASRTQEPAGPRTQEVG